MKGFERKLEEAQRVIRPAIHKNWKKDSFIPPSTLQNYMGELRTTKLTDVPEYRVWSGMRLRCNSSRNPAYKDYGGRGIKICKRWETNFYLFFIDMGKRPTNKHSIERINNDGNYEPANCKWATRTEQMRNTRRTKKTRQKDNDYSA